MKRGRVTYSAEELGWVSDNRALMSGDLHAAFCQAFGRDDVTPANLRGLRKRKGWLTGRTAGESAKLRKGRSRFFSPVELDWLAANYTMTITAYHAAFCAQFGRSIHPETLSRLRKRKGWKTGRTGHFVKGAAPANKGKKMLFNAASAATQFKPGIQPPNTKFAGHERIGHDGYVWISIQETDPHTGFERRYVQKHRHLWEKANGPVPEGMVLKCLGERTNSDPSNWKAIPRGMVPLLSGRFGRNYDKAPAELKPTILAIVELKYRARQVTKDSAP